MELSASERVQHAVNNALTKIKAPLQVLELHTPLSDQQRQLVNAALQGLVELDAILRDDINRQLIGLPAAPTSESRPRPDAAGDDT
jgi:hypothetical protein